MTNSVKTAGQTHSGSIVCVGLGMTLGSHISPLSRSYIEQADIVFVGASHHLVELWVKEMNPNVLSLQVCYAPGKDRRISYQEMVDMMMLQVRSGKKVVGAFYGHPGIFALPPHNVIRQAQKEGFAAHMEAGISAEACLYADIGVDPGKFGCQQYETSQFMFYKRVIDPTACLILWQIGLAGDQSMSQFYTDRRYRELLVELLIETYPKDHKVALYECAVLPIHETRVEWLTLQQLCDAQVSQHTTLYIPPSQKMKRNDVIRSQLTQLDKQ
jgi:hypothetical protein